MLAAISSKARALSVPASKSERPGSPEASGWIGMRPRTSCSSSSATLSPPSPPKIHACGAGDRLDRHAQVRGPLAVGPDPQLRLPQRQAGVHVDVVTLLAHPAGDPR